MRITTLVCTLLAALSVSTANAQQLVWLQDVEQAKKIAHQSNRLVLLHFETTWCKACQIMKQTVFNNPQVAQSISRHYVPVQIDADKNRPLALYYGINRLPTDVIIRPNGQIVAKLASPQTALGYVNQMDQIAQATPTASPDSGANATPIAANTARPSYGQPPARTPPARQPLANNQHRFGAPAANTATTAPRGNFATPAPNRNFGQPPPRGPLNGGAMANNAGAPGWPSPAATPPSGQRPIAGNGHFPARPQNPTPPAATHDFAGNGGGGFNPGPRPMNPRPPIAGQAPNLGQPNNWPNKANRNTPPNNQFGRPPIQPNNPNRNTPPNNQFGRPPIQPNKASNAGANLRPEPRRPVAPANNPPMGMEGFCPIALVEGRQWISGDKRWGAIHEGRTYLFSSADAQKKFLADPVRYAPILNGLDPVLALDVGQSVDGRRKHGVYAFGRVYMFANEDTLQHFAKNIQRYRIEAIQNFVKAQQDGTRR